LPVLFPDDFKRFIPPIKNPYRLRIADSHEFVELYRGDKDLRVGKVLCQKYNCEFVQLGTDIASPADSRVFKTKSFPFDQIGQLPENYYLLLMKTRLIVHRKGNISLGGFFRWTPGIARQLFRWKPDLILENPYLTLTPRSYMTFFASKLMKIPLVYLDCGDIMPQLTLKHKIVLPFEKRVIGNAAAVITYNIEGKKRFTNKYGYPSNKIYVIPKPIDTLRFNPDVDCQDFKKKYSLGGKFVVGYFGRLCTNKGARYLLDVADIMRSRQTDDNTTFLFVGGNLEADQSAEFRNHLHKLKLDNVKLTGMVPNKDIPEAYAAVDIAVYPDVTNLPGFSTVLAESMASGKPIIIGIKGWEDAIPIIDGETGLIIEARNPKQIADRIELLKADHNLRKKLSGNVLKFAKQEMDYDKVVAKYYNIFCKLTGKKLMDFENKNVDSPKYKLEKTAV